MEITLNMVVQAVLAIAALWYAWETRGLNKKAAEQIEVSRRQMRLRMAPTIQAAVEPTPSQDTLIERMEAYEEEQDEPLSQERREQIQTLAEQTRFGVQLRNVSDRVPRYLTGVVYDYENRNFLRTQRRELLEPGQTSIVATLPEAMNESEIRDWLDDEYGEAAGPTVQSHLEHRDTSYILVFYEDVESNLYTYRQDFELDDEGDVRYTRRSRLLFEV